jgi:hypothetical protein
VAILISTNAVSEKLQLLAYTIYARITHNNREKNKINKGVEGLALYREDGSRLPVVPRVVTHHIGPIRYDATCPSGGTVLKHPN